MHEGWSDSNGNLGMAIDFEDAKGLDHYPSIAGAYFAVVYLYLIWSWNQITLASVLLS